VAPVAELAAIAHREGAIVLLDAAQSAPHRPLDVQALGVDALVFSGHKAWGLGGVGVLWTRPALAERLALEATPLEDALPYEALMALELALDTLAASRTPALDAHRRDLATALDAGLRALPGARVLGPVDVAARLPLFSIAGAGMPVGALADALRAQGLVTRAGMHLAEPLHAALGLGGTLRVSAHTYNTLDEAGRLIAALEALLAP
jgi:cysteine desulfurase/selenocysteine lyase